MPISYECDDCPAKTSAVVESNAASEPEGWLVVYGEFLKLAGDGDGIRVLCPKCIKARGIKEPLWRWAPNRSLSLVTKAGKVAKVEKPKTPRPNTPKITKRPPRGEEERARTIDDYPW